MTIDLSTIAAALASVLVWLLILRGLDSLGRYLGQEFRAGIKAFKDEWRKP